jgi:hypothetical protein
MASRKQKTPIIKAPPPPRLAASALAVCALSWLVPGVGHLWFGRRQKGLVFLVMLPLMFAIGIALKGRLFSLLPLDLGDPLVALAALADLGAGLVYFVAKGLGYGAGQVVAVTYEYGNAFMIVAGLLNSLVVIDVYDIALGRK